MSREESRSEPRGPRAVSRDRLYYSSLLCGSSVVIFLACIWVFNPELAPAISWWGAGSTLVCAGVAARTYRRQVPAQLLPAVGALLAVGIYATLFYAFLVIRLPVLTLFVVMIVLAASVMQSSTAWLLLTVVVLAGSWLVAGVAMFGADYVPVATGLVFSTFVAIYMHLFVVRHVLHLRQLRHRERQHAEELAAALAAAHHELTERQRAEAERERLREQLLHSQKLEAIGTLAGGIAHDMNNVLAAVIGAAELARDQPDSAREGLELIIESARRGADLVRNLLGFSRRGQYRKERIELTGVVARMSGLLRRTLPKEIDIVTAGRADRAVEGDVAQLSQVLLNLCINASDAMSGRGVLKIRLDEAQLEGPRALALGVAEGRYVALTVADEGCGMDEATRARMFEPFFTTKAPGRGRGRCPPRRYRRGW